MMSSIRSDSDSAPLATLPAKVSGPGMAILTGPSGTSRRIARKSSTRPKPFGAAGRSTATKLGARS